MTCLNSTKYILIWIREPDPEMRGGGGGVVFKVRMTLSSFWHQMVRNLKKAELSSLTH